MALPTLSGGECIKLKIVINKTADDTKFMPQGSVLEPLLFATYCSPISSLCHLYGAQQQQYADNTALYFSLTIRSEK